MPLIKITDTVEEWNRVIALNKMNYLFEPTIFASFIFLAQLESLTIHTEDDVFYEVEAFFQVEKETLNIVQREVWTEKKDAIRTHVFVRGHEDVYIVDYLKQKFDIAKGDAEFVAVKILKVIVATSKKFLLEEVGKDSLSPLYILEVFENPEDITGPIIF